MKAKPALTRFIVGETSFFSRGVSKIKTTVDGKEDILEVPIKSIGIVELQQTLDRQRPKPKDKLVIVKKDSAQGRALSLEEDTAMNAQDVADPEYQAQLREHNRSFLWRMLAQGLDVEFADAQGNRITDQDRIVDALKGSGITSHQADQLMADIQALTRRRETKADFLSGAAWA